MSDRKPSRPPRVMLLTGMGPCRNFTAGLVLEQLCSFLPEETLGCFAVEMAKLHPERAPILERMPFATHPRPRENWGTLPPLLGVCASLVMENTWSAYQRGKVIRKAVQFGRAFGADRLWCVLEGQTLIQMARPVADALGVPLYTQVWDPPRWWIRAHRVNPLTGRRVLTAFAHTVRSSACCGTASWAMAERYTRDYGARTVPLLPSLDPGTALPPARQPRRDGDLTIAVAGQIYCLQEWQALLDALDWRGWTLCGRPVRIQILSRYAALTANGRANIQFLGWRSQAESLQILSAADILYCPYWFARESEGEARLSFPSKLTTYLAAGRPVFFHGPEYASPARFLQEHKAGICCHTLAPAEIAAALEGVLSDEQAYGTVARNGRAAFDRYLTFPILKDAFFRFLDIPSATGAGCTTANRPGQSTQ